MVVRDICSVDWLNDLFTVSYVLTILCIVITLLLELAKTIVMLYIL